MERRSPLLVAGVVAAVVVAGLVGIAIGASLDDDDGGGGGGGGGDDVAADGGAGTASTAGPVGPSTPVSTVVAPFGPLSTEGLDGAALELAESVNQALQLTYHATYETAGAAEPVVVDIWRRPPFARRDTVTGAAPDALNISEYRTAENAHVGCLLGPEDTGQDLCVLAPPEGVDPADPIMGVIDPAAMTVAASDATVAGVAARCFTALLPDGLTAEACFDGDGIPVAIDGGDGRLQRTALERGVADDVFVLPASPSAGPGGG